MTTWNKLPVTKQQADLLVNKYQLESKLGNAANAQILASILVRRGITEGEDLLYFFEDGIRFQHEPFCFNSMEDAVERILQAKEEGEKVLIFGDKDVDGITSTTILYKYLKSIDIDVECRIPVSDDAYGLSIAAVDDFYAKNGTLIITVDCGISNFAEIEHANELGIDVIVTDHHNPQNELPPAIIIIDPKIQDSGYPFPDISGAAVAYKLVSALRFAQSDFYNAEICILDIQQNKETKNVSIDCVKIKNSIKVKQLHEEIIPGKTTIYDTKLPYFLQGQVIFAWDSRETKLLLAQLFGNNIDFNLQDLRTLVTSLFPTLKNKTSLELLNASQIAKYTDQNNTVIDSLFNLYVSYSKKHIIQHHPDFLEAEKKELQLVALAAIADIMPLKNENRIFVKAGINSIKQQEPVKGLAELFAILPINKDSITATSLSWNVTPALNSAGRLGQADVALELLISEDPAVRENKARQIFELNEKRKQLVNEAAFKIKDAAYKSFNEYAQKLCLVVDSEIERGITGNYAAKLMKEYNVPAIAIKQSEDICTGSMRSCRGVIATKFLERFGNIFINYGGHNNAAGFSFYTAKLGEFLAKAKESLASVVLEPAETCINIDAEIPPSFLKADTFKLLDILEPFGCENETLKLITKEIPLKDAVKVGKKEPLSLKLTFDTGSVKFPAMLWGEGDKLGNEINIGEKYDILYNMSWNFFNGNTTPQLEIQEIRKSN